MVGEVLCVLRFIRKLKVKTLILLNNDYTQIKVLNMNFHYTFEYNGTNKCVRIFAYSRLKLKRSFHELRKLIFKTCLKTGKI